MTEEPRDFKVLYNDLEEDGLLQEKDDDFKTYMLADKADSNQTEDAFYDILQSLGVFYDAFKGTVISEELKDYVDEIRKRWGDNFKGIKDFMKPLSPTRNIDEYLADDEDESTKDKIRDIYKGRFANVLNLLKEVNYPPNDENKELMMITKAVKGEVIENLKENLKTEERYISIDNELYLKSKRDPLKKSVLQNEEENDELDKLSAPAIVEIGLNENVLCKVDLENILLGDYTYDSRDINKACEILSNEKENFILESEAEPKPKIEFHYENIITQEFINNFDFDTASISIGTAKVTPTPKIDYTIGLYKVQDDLSLDHLKAYLGGVDNFNNSKELDKFFKKEVEIEGIPKTAFDALLDSTIITLKKGESEMLVTADSLINDFGINEKLIEILKDLNFLVCTGKGYYFVTTSLIRKLAETASEPGLFEKLWDFSQTNLKIFLA